MRAHVKYLASDELEGRGVGTRGEKLATEYLASQLKASGVKPGGDNSTYFQPVPLVGCTTKPEATMTIRGKNGDVPLTYVRDYVGTATSQKPVNDFNAEAVFVVPLQRTSFTRRRLQVMDGAWSAVPAARNTHS
jgi:hypothetical protein